MESLGKMWVFAPKQCAVFMLVASAVIVSLHCANFLTPDAESPFDFQEIRIFAPRCLMDIYPDGFVMSYYASDTTTTNLDGEEIAEIRRTFRDFTSYDEVYGERIELSIDTDTYIKVIYADSSEYTVIIRDFSADIPPSLDTLITYMGTLYKKIWKL